ncbi:hypothetical protein [Nocardioides sp. WS12]|uniref:hypothetical protein n=1 Tax=Nocardioides sp. WS12 TaxID=2486272 RepID=UPI0015FC2BED|nr:hypothetical protein [Nocardioides sp. WS12]
MRFTEHELTVALTGAAKTVVAANRKVRKGGKDIDTVWNEMDRHQRYKVLDALGDQILPVLVALPDVEVEPGTRPSYTNSQVTETITGLVGDELGKLRRAVVIKARTSLVQTALASVPPRLDPDALINASGEPT